MESLIILQLIAHFVSDFDLQSQAWCDAKSKRCFCLAHFQHALVIFLVHWGLSFSWAFVLPALCIAVIHFLLDQLKSRVGRVRSVGALQRHVFFIDQALHIVAVLVVGLCYIKLGGPLASFLPPSGMVAALLAFVLCGTTGNFFVKHLMASFGVLVPESKTGDDEDLENAGKLIGVAERYITLLMILANQYAAIGLLIAAKSILRFETAKKNEYVLVGTLLSFGLAFFVGALLRFWGAF